MLLSRTLRVPRERETETTTTREALMEGGEAVVFRRDWWRRVCEGVQAHRGGMESWVAR